MHEALIATACVPIGLVIAVVLGACILSGQISRQQEDSDDGK